MASWNQLPLELQQQILSYHTLDLDDGYEKHKLMSDHCSRSCCKGTTNSDWSLFCRHIRKFTPLYWQSGRYFRIPLLKPVIEQLTMIHNICLTSKNSASAIHSQLMAACRSLDLRAATLEAEFQRCKEEHEALVNGLFRMMPWHVVTMAEGSGIRFDASFPYGGWRCEMLWRECLISVRAYLHNLVWQIDRIVFGVAKAPIARA